MAEPEEVSHMDADYWERNLTWEQEEDLYTRQEAARLLYDSASKPLTQEMRAALGILLDSDDRGVGGFVRMMEFMEKTRLQRHLRALLYPLCRIIQRVRRH